ncbi:MAG: GIY-YIG nuclease family protein [bacterium]|nr:GIY-YIG nuclease family protein [bacterium]
MYFAYIVRCVDGTLYAGSTNNLEKRIRQHNESKSGAHYTKIRRPVALVYSEEYTTFKEARAREAAIKQLSRKMKLALIETKRVGA